MPEFSEFSGRWTLARLIRDRRDGSLSRFAGHAVLSPSSAGLGYEESGELHLPDRAAIHAERRYFWRAEAGRIAVDFADGQRFHHFDPCTEAPEALHACPPDSYAVCYDFRDWPRWQTRWTVTGPRKDYTSTSLYAPAQASTVSTFAPASSVR